jgi:hypothetical protein
VIVVLVVEWVQLPSLGVRDASLIHLLGVHRLPVVRYRCRALRSARPAT